MFKTYYLHENASNLFPFTVHKLEIHLICKGYINNLFRIQLTFDKIYCNGEKILIPLFSSLKACKKQYHMQGAITYVFIKS